MLIRKCRTGAVPMISSIARFASSVSVRRSWAGSPVVQLALATPAQHAPLHRAEILCFVDEQVGIRLVRQLEGVGFSCRGEQVGGREDLLHIPESDRRGQALPPHPAGSGPSRCTSSSSRAPSAAVSPSPPDSSAEQLLARGHRQHHRRRGRLSNSTSASRASAAGALTAGHHALQNILSRPRSETRSSKSSRSLSRSELSSALGMPDLPPRSAQQLLLGCLPAARPGLW